MQGYCWWSRSWCFLLSSSGSLDANDDDDDHSQPNYPELNDAGEIDDGEMLSLVGPLHQNSSWPMPEKRAPREAHAERPRLGRQDKIIHVYRLTRDLLPLKEVFQASHDKNYSISLTMGGNATILPAEAV
jgi:hypothetical protein